MKLGSGMEAWPSSRLGDRFASDNYIGRVSHIRPTTPKPQPVKENKHHEQAETTNTIRKSSSQPTEGRDAHHRYARSYSLASTRQAVEERTRGNESSGKSRMGHDANASYSKADTTLWF